MTFAKIVVGSSNPVKVDAVAQGFMAMFPEVQFEVIGTSVPSGVSDQPFSDAETLQGAVNRAQNALSGIPEADYWVGIEGGIEDDKKEMCGFAWVVIHGFSPFGTTLVGQSRTGTFQLPPEVASLVRQGVELGTADDIVFKRHNSKQGNGAVGILTQDVIDRTSYYSHAVALALIPFLNPDLYTSLPESD